MGKGRRPLHVEEATRGFTLPPTPWPEEKRYVDTLTWEVQQKLRKLDWHKNVRSR